MLEFYFEYLRASGELVQIVCEARYEESLHTDTDSLMTNVLGLDIVGITDEAGTDIELAPWELEDAHVQAEEHALRVLLRSNKADVARWTA